jgi:hypothetical protein
VQRLAAAEVLLFVDMSEKKDQNISQMAWEDDGGTTSS